MSREPVLRDLANRIGDLNPNGVTKVAIDGITAAGKTTLANELAFFLGRQRPVERMSMDDYHTDAEQRYRRGRYSPEGYYHDAFDYESFLGALGGMVATPGLIVLVDGVFLLRPELNATWDYRVFLEVDTEIAYERGILRDASSMGGEDEAQRRYELRYIPGERLYIDEVNPVSVADAVVENTDPDAPRLRMRD